jgi:hypothetical protein
MGTFIESAGAWDALIQVLAWVLGVIGLAWEWAKVGLSLVWAAMGYALDWMWLWVDPSGRGFWASMWDCVKTALVAIGVLLSLVVMLAIAISKPTKTKPTKSIETKQSATQKGKEPEPDAYKADEYYPVWRTPDGRTYSYNPGRGAREV